MARHLPLTALATVDPVLRDSVVFGMVTDAPGTVVLRHDIVDDDGDGAIRRVVLDHTGVVEDVLVPLEHACLSCAVREDAIPVLRDLASQGRWSALVLALPVSAESLPVARALGWAARRGGDLPDVRLASVVGAVDVETCEHDLLGDDLLDERGLGLTEDDRRSVGEALAAQVGHVDVLVVAGERGAHPVGSDLLDHLRANDAVRVDGLHELDTAGLHRMRHDTRTAERRLDPVHAAPVQHAPTGNGVWSLDLRSPRPMHPERLLERIEDLGSGRLRSRGVFWVPDRPHSACVWDGAGGQLSIGELGPWRRRDPFTRLVYTGCGDEAPALRETFDSVILSDAEDARGLAPWLGAEDALAPWLGERSGAW
ncbi:CobW family GTP-binding protein [Cellulomonas bogoriensis]|uniref:Cobalamin biosynthesis protein CobW n=1 Tax=Cellulomonas bogoriensis 69B4 = DSM 16987 TaxID=1386082 RepID=A0A0A0C2T5_9CELL|nr:GTP-binding protein [Cellulomonas bogoriensis]KGM14510.1 cobalamin biosynthesis protein CobW [Cellulomonas bogoriensis 69B4 = DSM 16987]